MASDIKIATHAAVNPAISYCLCLRCDRDPLEIVSIVVRSPSNARTLVLEALLQAHMALPVPASQLLDGPDGNGDYTFKSLAALGEEGKAKLAELARRLAVQEIVWGAAGTRPFLALPFALPSAPSGEYRGDARLAVDLTTGNWSAEFSVRAEAVANGAVAGAKACVAFTLALGGEASLRLDLDHLNLGLPALTLPSFDLSNVRSYDFLGFPGAGVARALARFFPPGVVGVQFDMPAGQNPPKLSVDPGNQQWALVDQAGHPAALRARVNIATAPATIELRDIRLSGGPNAVNISVGGADASATLPLADNQIYFGPIVVKWLNARVTPTYDGVTGAWLLRLTIDRLSLEAADDPSARVAVAVRSTSRRPALISENWRCSKSRPIRSI